MTDLGTVDDTDVAALVPEWRVTDDDFLVRAVAPEGASDALRVVQHMTSLHDIEDLRLLAAGVTDGGTRATDGGGYAMNDDEVVVWDAGENEVHVSRAAFTDLMARLVSLAVANRDSDAEATEVWDDLARLAGALGR